MLQSSVATYPWHRYIEPPPLAAPGSPRGSVWHRLVHYPPQGTGTPSPASLDPEISANKAVPPPLSTVVRHNR